MSSDNMLIAIPAKDGQVALYDVFLSDLGVNLDAPSHQVCAHVAHTYANRRVGVYANHQGMEAAAANYMETAIVEYGLVDLTRPRTLPAVKPRIG